MTRTAEVTTGRLPCRWCRARATALRDGVELCRACASVVDQLAEHARRADAARAAWNTPQHHEQRPTHHLKRSTMKGGA